MKDIGQQLKSARQKKGFSIEDANKFIKVHPKYIIALEENDYSIFEGRVHSKGFLKIYAQFLELDLDELLALWRREYEHTFKEKNGFEEYKPLEFSKFVITPAIVVSTFVIISLFVFFGYLYFQYRQYAGAPNLEIYHPQDNQILASDILDITGKTDVDSEIFINNQGITSDADGTFLTSVKLKEGINTISIRSTNKLNRETEELRTVIYRPEKIEEVRETTESTDEKEI
ncbi:helix-turn-helix domain-containing protein [Patescibacteria group bacterium]